MNPLTIEEIEALLPTTVGALTPKLIAQLQNALDCRFSPGGRDSETTITDLVVSWGGSAPE